jgi:probable O-glycosylation ligase (exosortase A-associated)
MRDLVVTLLVFGSLPFIFMRPYIGILVWSWLSYMNPHRLTWGFAYDFPFAQIVAIATFVGLLFHRERKGLPWTSTLVVWLLFVVWMNVTTPFALNPDEAWSEWNRTMKIQLVSLLSLWLMQSRERIQALVWVIVASLGFFGVKGGIFGIVTGGQYRVYGPEGSFIDDNNAIGLALIMTLPLMRYLQLGLERAWQRWALTIMMLLTGVAVLSTQSRGALLAGLAMTFMLMMKSRQKVWLGLALLIAVPLLLNFMPEQWHERMGTITQYQQDSSAEGRINAWWFAYNIALERPLIGGGFDTFTSELFLRYAPNPTDFHDAHSIYFEVLGEHGFIGLALFLWLGYSVLRTGRWVARTCGQRSDLTQLVWARDLAAMLQVSLVGYAVGGAFLGLAYFDLYYHLIVLMLLVQAQVRATVAATPMAVPSVDGSRGYARSTAAPPSVEHRVDKAPWGRQP